jgi:SAM-dependent methyltransferase
MIDGQETSVDERIASLLRGGHCLLDLGCGDGGFLDAVASRYRMAIGIDLRATCGPERRGVRQWTYMTADLDDGIPAESWSADAIHSNQVIEHVKNPLAFLAETHRVLRSGGVLVVTTPNVRYLPHVWRLLVRGQGPITSRRGNRTLTDWDDGHIHFLTPTDLEWASRRVGFHLVRTSALVNRSGRLRPVRKILDRASRLEPVKSFLSGNTLLVAVKQ